MSNTSNSLDHISKMKVMKNQELLLDLHKKLINIQALESEKLSSMFDCDKEYQFDLKEYTSIKIYLIFIEIMINSVVYFKELNCVTYHKTQYTETHPTFFNKSNISDFLEGNINIRLDFVVKGFINTLLIQRKSNVNLVENKDFSIKVNSIINNNLYVFIKDFVIGLNTELFETNILKIVIDALNDQTKPFKIDSDEISISGDMMNIYFSENNQYGLNLLELIKKQLAEVEQEVIKLDKPKPVKPVLSIVK